MTTTRPNPTGRADWSNQYMTACKTGFDTMLALTNATLRGCEHMRMMQLATDVETQAQNRKAAEAVAGVRDVTGLVGLQAELAKAYLDGWMRYWTGMAECAREMNAAIAEIMQRRMGELGVEWQKAVATGGSAAGIPAPIAQAFESARAQQEAVLKSLTAMTTPPVTERKAA